MTFFNFKNFILEIFKCDIASVNEISPEFSETFLKTYRKYSQHFNQIPTLCYVAALFLSLDTFCTAPFLLCESITTKIVMFKVRHLQQSRRYEILNFLKPYNSSSII